MFAQAFLLTRPWGLHADDVGGQQRTDLCDGGSVELPAGCGLFAVAADELTLRFSGRKQLSAQREGGTFNWNGRKRFWSLPCGSSLDEAHFRLLIESSGPIETVDIRLVDSIANPREADEDSAGGRQKRLLLALVRHVRSLVDDHTGQVEYHALGRKLLAASVPWEVATDAWCRDASLQHIPPLDIIVRHAETLQRNIDILANHPRRILKRIRERQPIARLEELDAACLEWYVRQPGRTALEKAGTRQVLLGVARHENFDTSENRVLRGYLRLAAGAALAYTALYAALRRSQRMVMVERFGRVCRLLDRDLEALEINLPSPPILPNYVLQQDVNYRRIWQGYLDLLRRKQEEDDSWRWQGRLWAEFSRLSLLVALRRLDGARIFAETPLLVRNDQQRGRWVDLSPHPAVVAVPIEGRLLAVTVIDAQAEQASQFGGPDIWGYLWSIGPAFVLHAQDVASGEVTWVLVWGLHPIDGQEIDLHLEVNSADAALAGLRDRIRADGGGLQRMRGIVLVSHPSLEGEAQRADFGETMAYISASEGFRIRIEKTLDAIRRQVLFGHPHRVRVVLTGRPSDDVNEAKFLLDETPVLTVRPFTRLQLKSFVDRLMEQRGSMLPNSALPPATSRRISGLLEQFDKDGLHTGRKGQSILGLPLLALLAMWLVLNDENPPDDLIAERSSLYRRLVDLTTRYGGNVEPIGPAAPKITGDELRDLLQRTAAAMTLRGTEHIPHDELLLRLEASGLTDPETVVGRAVVENQIAKLMLSFFFNTGQREQGCEFIHKSFREYLFAEAIVEALKRNAALPGTNQPRAAYWREFEDGDPRQALADELGLMLAPHWIRPEVWRHLLWLIKWEVGRTAATGGTRHSDEESLPLALHDWEVVRDRLVDLWDWWAEGVHMRPQPYRERGKSSIDFNKPYALRLAEKIAPSNLPRGSFPEPVRLTTLDAHLGDALLRLNCALHFQINKATGWLDRPSLSGPDLAESIWEGAQRDLDGGRRYQTRILQGERTWWAFAPSSPDGTNHYLEHYFSRINAAGWYPHDRFPFAVDFSGVDFHSAPLPGFVFREVRFDYARLTKAHLPASVFLDCVFTATLARESDWIGSRIGGSDLESANLEHADFEHTLIADAFPEDAAIPPHFRGAIFVSGAGEPRRI